MNKFKDFLQGPKSYWISLTGFVVIGLILILWQGLTSKEPADALPEVPQSADTLIPRGYVLVPIQIHNEMALQSLLGAYGVVDLFLPIRDGAPGERVAKGVKIIRAPLNPSQFAVLIPEDQSQELVKQGGPFIAVVQNPQALEGRVLEEKKAKPSRLSFGY